MVLFPKHPQVTPSPIQSILQVRNWVGNTLQNHTEDSRGVQGPLLRTVGISYRPGPRDLALPPMEVAHLLQVVDTEHTKLLVTQNRGHLSVQTRSCRPRPPPMEVAHLF